MRRQGNEESVAFQFNKLRLPAKMSKVCPRLTPVWDEGDAALWSPPTRVRIAYLGASKAMLKAVHLFVS